MITVFRHSKLWKYLRRLSCFLAEEGIAELATKFPLLEKLLLHSE